MEKGIAVTFIDDNTLFWAYEYNYEGNPSGEGTNVPETPYFRLSKLPAAMNTSREVPSMEEIKVGQIFALRTLGTFPKMDPWCRVRICKISQEKGVRHCTVIPIDRRYPPKETGIENLAKLPPIFGVTQIQPQAFPIMLYRVSLSDVRKRSIKFQKIYDRINNADRVIFEERGKKFVHVGEIHLVTNREKQNLVDVLLREGMFEEMPAAKFHDYFEMWNIKSLESECFEDSVENINAMDSEDFLRKISGFCNRNVELEVVETNGVLNEEDDYNGIKKAKNEVQVSMDGDGLKEFTSFETLSEHELPSLFKDGNTDYKIILHSSEKNMNVMKSLDPIETHCFPAILTRISTILVVNITNDSNSLNAFLLPLFQMLYDTLDPADNEDVDFLSCTKSHINVPKFHLKANTFGPKAIVLCPYSSQCSEVTSTCNKLIMENFRNMEIENNVNHMGNARARVRNVCLDVLICTPSSLLAGRSKEDYVNFKRLRHFVFLDASTLFAEKFKDKMEQVKKAFELDAFFRIHPVQEIYVSDCWTNTLAEKLQNDIMEKKASLIFESALEAVLYFKASFWYRCHEGQEKWERLIPLAKRPRTVIFGDNPEEIKTFLLQSSLKDVFIMPEEEKRRDIEKKLWKTTNGCLICTDESYAISPFRGAFSVVHFNMPESYIIFSFRHFVLYDNLMARKPGYVVFFIAETSSLLYLQRIMKRFSPEWYMENESLIKILTEKLEAGKKGVELCPSLMHFGECKAYSCLFRHKVIGELDTPVHPLPKKRTEVTLHITHYMDPSHFVGFLTHCRDEKGMKRRVCNTYFRLKLKMDSYLKLNENQETHPNGKVGDYCVIRGECETMFERVKIIHKKDSMVKLLLIDVGSTTHVKASVLIKLPEEFGVSKFPSSILHFHLPSIVPVDHDMNWDVGIKEKFRELLRKRLDSQKYEFTGMVNLILGKNVFLDDLKCQANISGEFIPVFSAMEQLVKEGLAVFDENSMGVLYDLCKRGKGMEFFHGFYNPDQCEDNDDEDELPLADAEWDKGAMEMDQGKMISDTCSSSSCADTFEDALEELPEDGVGKCDEKENEGNECSMEMKQGEDEFDALYDGDEDYAYLEEFILSLYEENEKKKSGSSGAGARFKCSPAVENVLAALENNGENKTCNILKHHLNWYQTDRHIFIVINVPGIKQLEFTTTSNNSFVVNIKVGDQMLLLTGKFHRFVTAYAKKIFPLRAEIRCRKGIPNQRWDMLFEDAGSQSWAKYAKDKIVDEDEINEAYRPTMFHLIREHRRIIGNRHFLEEEVCENVNQVAYDDYEDEENLTIYQEICNMLKIKGGVGVEDFGTDQTLTE